MGGTPVVTVPRVRDFLLTLIDDAIARRELVPASCEDCREAGGRCPDHVGDPAKARAYMDLYGLVQAAETGTQLESAIIAVAQIEADHAEAAQAAVTGEQ
jgi:hypothetical protein